MDGRWRLNSRLGYLEVIIGHRWQPRLLFSVKLSERGATSILAQTCFR